MSELERIERRLQETERLLIEVMVVQQQMGQALKRIEALLEEPTTYPASRSASITVK